MCLSILTMLGPLSSSAQTVLEDAEVPFLTVRNQTEAADPGEAFGEERSDLSAGYCRVDGSGFQSLSFLSESVPGFLKEELLRIDEVVPARPDAVLDGLTETSATAPVLYVHGYYINFKKGCRRAALFQDNANLADRFLWFSWPSNGALALYAKDEADLYWSVPDIADAIIELADRSGGGMVDVAGHSLGGRGVVLALYDVANRRPDIRLDDIVLLAPDMDFGIFQRILPRISAIVENLTIYVTDNDRALTVSAQVHGYSRLGEAGNDFESLAGVEVIDVSDLPTDSPSGHVYHIYSPSVGDDLDQLLNEGKHAASRRNLVQVGSNTWRLREQDSDNPQQ